MILNARNNQFQLNFPDNFFYPEVIERWEPVVKKLKLPYHSLVDFMNSNIQSVTFPSIELPTVSQQESQYNINWRGGKEFEAVKTKNIDITFKLGESYIPYWVIFDQISYYLEYSDRIPYWPNMNLTFLDNNGFEVVTFAMKLVVPTNLSELNLSHSSIMTDFKTATLSLTYNRFEVKNLISTGRYTSSPNY